MNKLEVIFKLRDDPDVQIGQFVTCIFDMPNDFDVNNYSSVIFGQNMTTLKFVNTYDIKDSKDVSYQRSSVEHKIAEWTRKCSTLANEVRSLQKENEILQEKVNFLEEDIWS